MTINLTTFCDRAASLRVMEHDSAGHGHDAGTAADVFDVRLALIQVGDAQGTDDARGAYEWYPLTISGDVVGELRDDANGLTIHIQRRNHPGRSNYRYFRVCPRGFSNEVRYYRVPLDKVGEVEAEYGDFSDRNPSGSAGWTTDKAARMPGTAIDWADRGY